MCVYFNRETPWPWLGRLVYFPNLLGWVELRGLPILIHTPNRPSMVGTRDEHVGYNLFCDYSQWHFCIQASQALPLSAGSDKRQTSTLPPRVDETCDVEETGWLANPQHRPCLEGGCPVGMWIFQPASCRTAGHLELGVEARLTGIANSHHPEIEHCIWVGTALRQGLDCDGLQPRNDGLQPYVCLSCLAISASTNAFSSCLSTECAQMSGIPLVWSASTGTPTETADLT